MFARDEYVSYRPLSAIVPPGIEWLPNGLLAKAMGITARRLRDDVVILKQLELVQLHEVEREIRYAESDLEPNPKRKRVYRCRRRGFNLADAEIIWLFRQAVKEKGRLLAIESMPKIVKDFYS